MLHALSPFQLRTNLGEESLSGRICCASRVDEPHERVQACVGIEVAIFSIRESGQAAKVPPVCRASVPSEFLSQGACGCSPHFLRQLLGMFQPCLEIARRRLDHGRWGKASARHLGDAPGIHIINQAEVVLPFRTNVDVSSISVFITKPSY